MVASVFSILLLCASALLAAPVELRIPQTISAEAPHLGLPQQEGLTHYVLYNPAKNPSLGWANHDVRMLRINDNQVVLWWTSHLGDENGPGQTIAATVVSVEPETGTPQNLDSLEFTKVTPAEIPVRRRTWDYSAPVVDEWFCHGQLCLRDGRLWFDGKLEAFHGVSDEMKESVKGRRVVGQPAVPEHFREKMDSEAGFTNEYEWILVKIAQRWRVEGNRLVPDSIPYLSNRIPETIEVLPGVRKSLPDFSKAWREFPLFSEASEELKKQFASPVVTDRAIVADNRVPKCSSGLHTAADGKNGLAHYSDYLCPDGAAVCIRDNLKNRGFYYAAVKSAGMEAYPPAEMTNLPGEAMPAAGNLPDGRAFIICNFDYRRNLYIVLSKDGHIFDDARFILRINKKFRPGIGKFNRKTGPHYPRAMLVGKKMWITYSIGKEQIGLTTIDLDKI